MIERSIAGEMLPLVWSHGDFSAGNCLYDRDGELSAVVDWELFSDCHLPLLDLLHCMAIPDEQNSHPTWQRFDAIHTLFRSRTAMDVPALASYVKEMGLSQRVAPALMIMYWVDHVEKRIDGRMNDPVWMEKRVFQPLSALASIELT